MTTAAERQSRRRTKLNKIAKDAEIDTWGKLETALLRNEIDITITKKGKIEMNKSYQEQAEYRVNHSPQLSKHASTILYDWPQGDEHWKWVATARVSEIVDWAETVEKE